MQKLLSSKSAPKILCEASKNGEEVRALLNKYNYGIYTLDESGNASPYSSGSELKGKNLLFNPNTIG